ncbi:hypothetical protein TNCV_1472381 [Trichonephila clavipes]|nr:hypothetical protein TNCV_1472381 [Trichonephila clavipes]
MTLLLCLKEEFPAKQSTAVLQRLAFTPGGQSTASLRLYTAKKIGYCGAENISRGHGTNGCMHFLVMSRNVPEKVILVESYPGEKLELAFISLA